MLCLPFLLSSYFTFHKLTRSWTEHGLEQLGASPVVKCGNLWAQMKGLRGQMWKRKKTPEHMLNTQAARELLKSFGTKSVSWDMVGKERKNCDFYYDRFSKLMTKFSHRIFFFRSPKTATIPVHRCTLLALYLIQGMPQQPPKWLALRCHAKLGYALQTCRNHWLPSVSNQKVDVFPHALTSYRVNICTSAS